MNQRLQLALNVPDLDAAVDYYQRLFGVDAAKRKPGYANFEVAEPPLKLVLFQNADRTDRLNHLGVEVMAPDQVATAADRQTQAGLTVQHDSDQTCCFARQAKAVSYAPDGTMWEWYYKHEDVDGFWGTPPTTQPDPGRCC